MFSISSGTRNRPKRDFKYNIDEYLERQVGTKPKEFWKLSFLGNCPRFAVLGILLHYFLTEVTCRVLPCGNLCPAVHRCLIIYAKYLP